jgi:hypothetical protein
MSIKTTYPVYITESFHVGLNGELGAAHMGDAVRLKYANLDGDRWLPRRARHHALQDERRCNSIRALIKLDVNAARVCKNNERTSVKNEMQAHRTYPPR